MTFLEKIKLPGFWTNVFKITVPFFIVVTIISLCWNSGSALFSGDFEKVHELNFSDGKWQLFWGVKIIISFLYGLNMTLKKTE